MSEDRKVVKKFDSQASRAVSHYLELILAVHNKRNQQSLESLLSEQLVMSVAVTWEAFLSDLLFTYMALDSKKGMQSLRANMFKSITERYGSDAAKIIRFSIPKQMSKARTAKLIDHKGWNWSFQTSATLSQRANDFLAAQYAKKFTLEIEDSRFLDFLVAFRNFLGHRSTASRSALKTALSQLGSGANGTLSVPFKNVGSYLKGEDANGIRRAVFMVNRLIEIANKL